MKYARFLVDCVGYGRPELTATGAKGGGMKAVMVVGSDGHGSGDGGGVS